VHGRDRGVIVAPERDRRSERAADDERPEDDEKSGPVRA
jgi:hypothetical protein